MTPAAIKHLGKVDPVMRAIIKRLGPCTLEPQMTRSPFESLVRAVAHQQLNGVAAATILTRFIALFPGKKFPSPEDIVAIADEPVRAAGFSANKLLAIRDIAVKTLEGVVPTTRKIESLSDEEIIERLLQVHGVGRWTVEMLLIFQLGRPDVLPVDDFGVRNGYRAAYNQTELPKPKLLAEYGERWSPHRTTAAWYLWRVADEDKKAAKPAKAK